MALAAGVEIPAVTMRRIALSVLLVLLFIWPRCWGGPRRKRARDSPSFYLPLFQNPTGGGSQPKLAQISSVVREKHTAERFPGAPSTFSRAILADSPSEPARTDAGYAHLFIHCAKMTVIHQESSTSPDSLSLSLFEKTRTPLIEACTTRMRLQPAQSALPGDPVRGGNPKPRSRLWPGDRGNGGRIPR